MPDDQRSHLRADCSQCFGLCCVVPAFSASADFAIDKPARQPCPNLRTDFGCSIHDRLRPRGFAGCAVYDCFGAGQHVSQVTFGGRDWRQAPDTAAQLFTVFPIMRELRELLWYLGEALTLTAATPLHAELAAARERTEQLTELAADALVELDVRAHWQSVNALLVRASELARAGLARRATEFRGADLMGRDLRGGDLRGANLRGAYLIGADLREADLRLADLVGADTRGADLRGADLSTSLFVAQSQLDAAAQGDQATRLPPGLLRPARWPGPSV
ncbi:pentapeptide repeat-containing protein [Saccharomonospora sp. NPDC046836]|uniref:pentapeptide repeat-containing protein n=1 Tax=Saccharomonospora sp. NPDC046836 TaxID=3156921 RepID=UPI0033C078DB